MNDNQKNNALIRKVKELCAELEKSKLKVLTLETMIEVAEEDLNIKIRKKVWYQTVKKNKAKKSKNEFGKYLYTVWCVTSYFL